MQSDNTVAFIAAVCFKKEAVIIPVQGQKKLH